MTTIIVGDGVNDIVSAASSQSTTQSPSVMAPETTVNPFAGGAKATGWAALASPATLGDHCLVHLPAVAAERAVT